MNTSNWQNFSASLVRYPDLGVSLDTSRTGLTQEWLEGMKGRCEKAFRDMAELEAGAIANPDEGRMVGHYWLRDASLAPTEEIRTEINRERAHAKDFAAAVHAGKITAAAGPFTDVLVVGIGGSALGPQLVADALNPAHPALTPWFFDNTDPDGISRVLAKIGDRLKTTLVVVISKSGGTKETRNGMSEAEHAFATAGLDFASQAVAVTGRDSLLDQHAVAGGWLDRFNMTDWVGGRTSVMSTVGLVPCGLMGVDTDAFLDGAREMDAKTRVPDVARNAAMLLALAWYKIGGGKGSKDMVILPYKDRLVLLSKYLQQLVMESLGKALDLDGNTVHQGIAVYGNKGSTDQHAYVQQLRDGVNNFFATFLEVRDPGVTQDFAVEPEREIRSADYLQGFLRGTRKALSESDRWNITISLPRVDAQTLGMVIALYERAVGYYADLVNINAYHQPGVEAGKKAAEQFLTLLVDVRAALRSARSASAEEIATSLNADPEDVHHCLVHLNSTGVASATLGENPAADRFTAKG